MAKKILFLTGKLAEKQLKKILKSFSNKDFNFEVRQIGISVAALMTSRLIQRRVPNKSGAKKILLPGLFHGDIDELSSFYKTHVERGPEDLKDLPEFFGKGKNKPDLSRYDCKIFSEIVNAPMLSVNEILERASIYKKQGSNVIDLGCLPDQKFPHLEKAVRALKRKGFKVSVDSANDQELLRGGRAGADYVLSLSERNIHIAGKIKSIPVLIPSSPGDLDSLYRVAKKFESFKRPFYLDPILDPIHYGFTESIYRYREVRRNFPKAKIFMGIGNLTELTDADTTGINALLMGIVSELNIGAVLVVQVSEHCQHAVREADLARRITYYAKKNERLPLGISKELMALHDRKPFSFTTQEVKEMAKMIKDRNFRIYVTKEGINVFNKEGLWREIDPFKIFPKLSLNDDSSHAFYMGFELAKAQIAWELGKRYAQDQDLDWGCSSMNYDKRKVARRKRKIKNPLISRRLRKNQKNKK
jgi:dihydropteroate synthase-like protein|tara:strand:- start:379 stop:1800 length:1422 start_codon:yes stop_codon:yes gene_type:complete